MTALDWLFRILLLICPAVASTTAAAGPNLPRGGGQVALVAPGTPNPALTRFALRADTRAQPPAPSGSGLAPASDLRLWYGVTAAAGVTIVILLVLLARSRRQRASRGSADPPDPPARPAFLELRDGSDTRFTVTGECFRVGRNPDNDLRLTHPSVSRRHAELRRAQDGSYTVRDADSMNGVYVNSQKVREVVLREGDRIEFGDVVMRFSRLPEPAASVTTAIARDTAEAAALRTVRRKGSG